jgi:hypothetical protein
MTQPPNKGMEQTNGVRQGRRRRSLLIPVFDGLSEASRGAPETHDHGA